ncbi:MAG: DUF72 domain-containing protein [Chloroflexi bacterium]|nr:DUF72 domain-containing protein [Chloroflexota bacterium]
MQAEMYLGTQGWSYKSWVGNFYPPATPPGDFLKEYAKQFRVVEIDSTYYGAPRDSTIQNWRAGTPDNFRFTAKFPQTITHEKMLKQVEGETIRFLDAMRGLGEKLGPLLLQFPYHFKPDQFDALAQFLAQLPGDLRFAIEVRHKGWLTDKFFALLEEFRVAYALTDYAFMPTVERVTTDFTYIRWLGNRKDIADDHYERVQIKRDKEIHAWSEIIANYLDKGVTIWGFANNHYQGHSPATVRAIVEQVGAR